MTFRKVAMLVSFAAALIVMCGITPCTAAAPATPPGNANDHASNFVVWQLKSSSNTIGMAYVFRMNNGQVAVLDGGWGPRKNKDAKILRAKLASLGNHVSAWFISHPHPDHAGALNAIVQDPGDLKIDTIYQSRLTKEQLAAGGGAANKFCRAFYHDVDVSGIPEVNFTTPGDVITLDKTKFMILSVRNPEIAKARINNSSMAIRVWDAEKSIVFLGDLQKLGGKKLLNGPYKKFLNCTYLQMAHHGNHGVSFDFYKSIHFSACLWPTPSWLWNNNVGKGLDTGPYDTVKLRNLVKSLGVTRNIVAWQGDHKIK